MILVVASTRDIASLNIHNQLLAHYDFEETVKKFHNNPVYHTTIGSDEVNLVTINEELIRYQTITDHFSPRLIVYISRHSSKSGTPTLSVHTPGNLADAEKGGIARKVSIAPGYAMKEALKEMEQQRSSLDLDYKVSYECTHHGPSLSVPTMFVELGSSLEQWRDLKAAEAVAHAAMASLSKRPTPSIVAVGIGGPHYSEKFTRMALEEGFAFGHMVPKYTVSRVDAEILRQCINRTVEEVETILLDWKGIRGADKPTLTEALKGVDVQTQKV
jgi:D-tyrosyl-tRNA(Tyr) deacylase